MFAFLFIGCIAGIDDTSSYTLKSNTATLIYKQKSNHLVTFLVLFDTLPALPALTSVALTSVALIYKAMAHQTGPRSTTQLALQRLATAAIDGRWTAAELAKNADCHIDTAKRFLASLVTTSRETVDKQVLSLADDYRHTLTLTAARSREYLQSIAHLDLDALDKDQRSLRKDALSSLSSLSSMLRLEITGDSSASTPPRLGNL